MNGDWFPWSGLYNGGSQSGNYGDPQLADGPERFRDAYRRIIALFRSVGVTNITWFFHVNASSSPDQTWNAIKNYYPGDDFIDWIGVSTYDPQELDESLQQFVEIMDAAYTQLIELTNKPIAILEVAVTEL